MSRDTEFDVTCGNCIDRMVQCLESGATTLICRRQTFGYLSGDHGLVCVFGEVSEDTPGCRAWAPDRTDEEVVRLQNQMREDAGFTPMCNICGMELRVCPHVPGRTYEGTYCTYVFRRASSREEGVNHG